MLSLIEHIKSFMEYFPGFLIGITVHEFAHAWSAYKLGDDTAYKQGRVTLDPAKHLCPIGTLLLIFAGFGWGKAVPINPMNFKKPRFHMLLSALAGPASNVIICLVSLALLYLIPQPSEDGVGAMNSVFLVLHKILIGSYFINIILAVINMLPIPPLDGSRLLPFIIPNYNAVKMARMEPMMFIVVLLIFQTGAVGRVISPVARFMNGLLPY